MTDTQLCVFIQWTTLYEMAPVLFMQHAIKINCDVVFVIYLQNGFNRQVSKINTGSVVKYVAEIAGMKDSNYSIVKGRD